MTDPVTEAVKADLDARQQRGILKYGVTLADNPLPLRAWLQHAYEECLDQAQYIKRAMMEMDKAPDDRYAEGIAEGLRIAAGIARDIAHKLRTNMDAFDPTGATQCIVVAQAIESEAARRKG